MIQRYIYQYIHPYLNKICLVCESYKIKPIGITLIGLFFSIVVGLCFSQGFIFLGTFFLIFVWISDLLDGILARKKGIVNEMGIFLDFIGDKYTDFFILGGLIIYYINTKQIQSAILVLGIILGMFVSSYTKEYINHMCVNKRKKSINHSEWILYLVIGFLFGGRQITIYLLCFFTNAVALKRIFFIRKKIIQRDEDKQLNI